MKITFLGNERYLLSISCVKHLEIDQNQGKCQTSFGTEICFLLRMTMKFFQVLFQMELRGSHLDCRVFGAHESRQNTLDVAIYIQQIWPEILIVA